MADQTTRTAAEPVKPDSLTAAERAVLFNIGIHTGRSATGVVTGAAHRVTDCRAAPSGPGADTDRHASQGNDFVHRFANTLSVAPRSYGFRRDDDDYVVFCFSEAVHADLFMERFEGERVS